MSTIAIIGHGRVQRLKSGPIMPDLHHRMQRKPDLAGAIAAAPIQSRDAFGIMFPQTRIDQIEFLVGEEFETDVKSQSGQNLLRPLPVEKCAARFVKKIVQHAG